MAGADGAAAAARAVLADRIIGFARRPGLASVLIPSGAVQPA
jgi:hypothetical protein